MTAGRVPHLRHPDAADQAGIATIYQELDLVDDQLDDKIEGQPLLGEQPRQVDKRPLVAVERGVALYELAESIKAQGVIQPIVVREKQKVAGIWMNADSTRFRSAPSFYAVASSRPSEWGIWMTRGFDMATLPEVGVGL